MIIRVFIDGRPLGSDPDNSRRRAVLNQRLPDVVTEHGDEVSHADIHLFRYETGQPHPSGNLQAYHCDDAISTSVTGTPEAGFTAARRILLTKHSMPWIARLPSAAPGEHWIPQPPAWARECHRPPTERSANRRHTLRCETGFIDIPSTADERSLRAIMTSTRISALFSPHWLDETTVTAGFQQGTPYAKTLPMGGFYTAENWGAWSRIDMPWVVLPFMVQGQVSMSITCMGLGKNLEKEITVSLGEHSQRVTLTASPSTHHINARIDRPCNILSFDGIIAERIPGIADMRTMGIGLIEISASRQRSLLSRLAGLWKQFKAGVSASNHLVHDGFLYLATIDPTNEDDNWQDLVTAFCEAFRHSDDVLLVLRCEHTLPPGFLSEYIALLHACGERTCKMVLMADDYASSAHRQLLNSAHFFVTARRADALCLDLLDAVAAGIPLIAPRHTSLRDIARPTGSLLVASEPEPCTSPDDPAGPYVGYRHRIDWQSLRNRLVESATPHRAPGVDVPTRQQPAHTPDAAQASAAMDAPIELILYSRYSKATIAGALGAADYSYYFVLQRFEKLLARRFPVVLVHGEDSLEPVIEASRQAGNIPLFLCFTPPHDLPMKLSCPVIPVFAWEFDTLPDSAWNDDPRNNWIGMLRQCLGAITHSEHTVGVARNALGDHYNIISAPASVWDSYHAIDNRDWTGAPRLLELEAAHLDTHSPAWKDAHATRNTHASIVLTGCVFTSVLNPHDGRKNLTDMISAFTATFRHQPDACLLLKFTSTATSHFIESARTLLRQLSPFQCRIVIISGYLPSDSFDDLVRATTFCVNASTGEGQCLPMMEFMSAGKPAVSPNHTAMAEYIDESNGFIVRSTPEPAFWPQDSRQRLTCKRMRISWQSLCEAYQEAFVTATTDPDRYHVMSRSAETRLHAHNAASVLEPRLETFLRSFVTDHGSPA